MLTTCILTLIMCVLLFLMIWSAVYFLPWKGLMDFFPEDIKEKAKDHKPPFKTAAIFGWICMILCMLGFIGVIVYGGWDGVQRNYTFGQFLVRFLIILFGVKAFDIVGLDYILSSLRKRTSSSIISRRPKAAPVITTSGLTGRSRSDRSS